MTKNENEQLKTEGREKQNITVQEPNGHIRKKSSLNKVWVLPAEVQQRWWSHEGLLFGCCGQKQDVFTLREASCGEATEQRPLWALRDSAAGSPPCGLASFSQWKREQTQTPGRVFAPSGGPKVRQQNQLAFKHVDLQEASPETRTR